MQPYPSFSSENDRVLRPGQCDVMVVGGGVAGAASAIAAARAGCSVVLAEKDDHLGGTGVNAMHTAICGFYGNGRDGGKRTLNGGLSGEIECPLRAAYPGSRPQRMGRTFVLPYRASDLSAVLRRLLDDEKNVTVCLGATVSGVKLSLDGQKIVAVRGISGSRRWTVRTSAVVDCSGTAMVAKRCGARQPLPSPKASSLGAIGVRFSGIGHTGLPVWVTVPFRLREAVESGELEAPIQFSTFLPGAKDGEGVIKFAVSPSRGKLAEEMARENVWTACELLLRKDPAFRHAEIEAVTPGIMRRMEGALDGRQVLGSEDVLGGKRFADAVAKCAWPIEFWDRETGMRLRHLPEGSYYEIPAGCLIARKVENLFAAGRCLSATPEAQASARVMGTCIATGEAAGQLAATAVRSRRI